MGYPIKNTQTNLTRELILELYTPNATEWGDLVRRFDEQDRFVEESEAPPSAPQAEDELAAWLGNIDLDDEHGHDHDHDHDHHAHGHGHGPGHGARRANTPSDADTGTRGYELYRWCGNPSAVLRKCGGCAKTRCVCCLCVVHLLSGLAAHEMIARRCRRWGGSIQILRLGVPEVPLDRAQGRLWRQEEVKLSLSGFGVILATWSRVTASGYLAGSLRDGDDDIIPAFASCLFPERLSGRASSRASMRCGCVRLCILLQFALPAGFVIIGQQNIMHDDEEDVWELEAYSLVAHHQMLRRTSNNSLAPSGSDNSPRPKSTSESAGVSEGPGETRRVASSNA